LLVQNNNEMVRFSVLDSGCGISKQDQSKLFGLFQQISSRKNREGTGLGLVISKGIISEHGGNIGVISDSGEGATFWFELLAAET
jgi:two-component system sensor histidine kinase BarA